MKIVFIAFCIMFFSSVVTASTCEVVSLTEQLSSPDVEITLRGATSSKNVKVDVYPYKEGKSVYPDIWGDLTPLFSIPVDDADGRLRLPKLGEGHYLVLARAEDTLKGSLYLSVVPGLANNVSEFSLQLSGCSMDESPDAMVSRAEQMPIRDRLQTFRGTVSDTTGAAIVGAVVHVVRKGTQGKERVAHLRSDATGHYSAELQEGYYLVFFSEPGFHTVIAPFEVTKKGKKEDLRITLDVRNYE